MPAGMKPFDSLPRVVLLPGVGALCAGKDAHAARIAHDITAQTLAAKARIAAMGTYRGLTEDHLFEMEYFTLQHAKLQTDEPPLGREVALVTGAAGAIGSAIAEGLLEQGCHVALTDLPGAALDNLGEELKKHFGERVMTAPLDVTNPTSVEQGFDAVSRIWGGVDLVIINAGLAMVSSLEQMDFAAFQRVERVNIEGALLLLRQSARHFRAQGNRRRHHSDFHQERLYAGRQVRRLQRHQSRGASTGAHRQPGNGGDGRARQHGGPGRGIFPRTPAALDCGRKSARTACGRAAWMKRGWRPTTSRAIF